MSPQTPTPKQPDALFIVSIEAPRDGELVTFATVCVADDPSEAAQIALAGNDDAAGMCGLNVRRIGGLKIIPPAALVDEHILVSELDLGAGARQRVATA